MNRHEPCGSIVANRIYIDSFNSLFQKVPHLLPIPNKVSEKNGLVLKKHPSRFTVTKPF